jgi:hypothetical protein
MTCAQSPGAVTLAVALVALACGTAGCKVQVVNQSGVGGGQDVKISTPLGGIAVTKNQTTAADLGLPAYPGASRESSDGDQSADVEMGFGEWRMRVKVAGYATPDPQEKVIAFYRQALQSYGVPIECAGNRIRNRPTDRPPAGDELTCGLGGGSPFPNVDLGGSEVQLKAGSLRHQHLVVFRQRRSPGTQFELIALDLPPAPDGSRKQTN